MDKNDRRKIYENLLKQAEETKPINEILLEKESINIIENPNRIQKTAFAPQYILEHGIENYIEKGCIEACKKLWDLNIYTFESSNNNAYPCAWIDLWDLSKENQKVFEILKKQGRAGINPFTHAQCLMAPVGDEAEITFLTEISQFNMQDISKTFYQTEEEFLDSQKRTNGKTSILDDGTIARDINPEYANLTLEEALLMSGKSHLYDKESSRIFEDEMSYQGYLKYQEYIKRNR